MGSSCVAARVSVHGARQLVPVGVVSHDAGGGGAAPLPADKRLKAGGGSELPAVGSEVTVIGVGKRADLNGCVGRVVRARALSTGGATTWRLRGAGH